MSAHPNRKKISTTMQMQIEKETSDVEQIMLQMSVKYFSFKIYEGKT